MKDSEIVQVQGRGFTFYLGAKNGVGIESQLQFIICRPINRNNAPRFRLAKAKIVNGGIMTPSDLINYMNGAVEIRTGKREWIK